MRLIVSFLVLILVAACTGKSTEPDVSDIKIPLATVRFERDFFALDTNQLLPGLEKILTRYPGFGDVFLGGILGIDPRLPSDSIANNVLGFLRYYRPINDTAQIIFSDFKFYENEIKEGLQRIKYYFPDETVPRNIVTYISPIYVTLDQPAYKNWCDFFPTGSRDTLMIGINYYLGSQYSNYAVLLPSYIYPEYLSRQFTPGQISIDCIKLLINDMYPNTSGEEKLLTQMVEKGKRLYLLEKLLPKKEKHLLIGYTEAQLKDCHTHERNIWNMFIKNNYLSSIEPGAIKNFVEDGPKTQELGEDAPGNIGSFAGWQIVRKYMDKFPDVTLSVLMKENADVIFEKSKYKP